MYSIFFRKLEIIKYHAQLQIWRLSKIICSFTVIYSNVIIEKKKHDRMEN